MNKGRYPFLLGIAGVLFVIAFGCTIPRSETETKAGEIAEFVPPVEPVEAASQSGSIIRIAPGGTGLPPGGTYPTDILGVDGLEPLGQVLGQ